MRKGKRFTAIVVTMCMLMSSATVLANEGESVSRKDVWKVIHTNTIIKVPASHLKAYKNLMKGKGQSGKVIIMA